VPQIGPDIDAMAGGSVSQVGTGGMITKIEAARIATRAGCAVVLGKGAVDGPIAALEAGAACTLFPAQGSPRRARKDWIAASLGVAGSLIIDEGAVRALKRGGSLLPPGVRAVEGAFEKGDTVLITTPTGIAIAKGLVAYDAGDARRIAGRQTEEIETILGYRGRDELVHRDDLVVL
jgi:glutamate 5-kinase